MISVGLYLFTNISKIADRDDNRDPHPSTICVVYLDWFTGGSVRGIVSLGNSRPHIILCIFLIRESITRHSARVCRTEGGWRWVLSTVVNLKVGDVPTMNSVEFAN
ncbi:hypothetical protein WAI453_010029 [Rhynchosporium graminicola]